MTLKELQDEFTTLREEAIYLIQTSHTFEDLFESGPEVEKILRKSAELFFGDINKIMIDYIILLICRLTDPPGKGKKINLTIPRMNKLLCENDLLDSEIEAQSCDVIAYRELVEYERNKMIAHADRDTLMHQNNTVQTGQMWKLIAHSEEKKKSFDDDLLGYLEAVAKAIGVVPLGTLSTSGSGDVRDLRGTLERGLIAGKLLHDKDPGFLRSYGHRFIQDPPDI